MRKTGRKSGEACRASPKQPTWQLRLYIADSSATSMLALTNLQLFCERYLKSRYTLRVIDILEDPDTAIRDGIIATPALTCVRPKPCKTLIGCLTNFEAVARALNVETYSSAPPAWPQDGLFIQEVGRA